MKEGENAFLEWLRQTHSEHPAVEVPPGDDAAVYRLPSGERLVLAADALAEGSHFLPGADPFQVGHKALAVNLSDLAAMGAEPLCALATCVLPHGFDAELPRRITAGLRACAERHACPLVGGDTVAHTGGVVLSVSVLGRPMEGGPITRAGAVPGDVLVVTGALGNSRSGRHLTFEPRLAEARALLRAGPPHALIDVSDGLLLDLHRLADASGVGFELEEERVPVHPDARSLGDPLAAALGDGEDFELLAALPAERATGLLAGWQEEVPLSRIGTIAPPGRRLIVNSGGGREAPRSGHEHV